MQVRRDVVLGSAVFAHYPGTALHPMQDEQSRKEEGALLEAVCSAHVLLVLQTPGTMLGISGAACCSIYLDLARTEHSWSTPAPLHPTDTGALPLSPDRNLSSLGTPMSRILSGSSRESVQERTTLFLILASE